MLATQAAPSPCFLPMAAAAATLGVGAGIDRRALFDWDIFFEAC
jgi:hypothetical protein